MIIEGKTYQQPPEGMWDAVCVDVVDLGIVDTGQWGKQHKLRVVWEINAFMDDGRRFTTNKRYTASLHEKSNFYKDLKSWRGRPFTAEEAKAFDTEKLIGAPCRLLIEHAEKDGTIYANIMAITKADPNGKLTPAGDYVRVKDRPEQSSANGYAKASAQDDADSVPF